MDKRSSHALAVLKKILDHEVEWNDVFEKLLVNGPIRVFLKSTPQDGTFNQSAYGFLKDRDGDMDHVLDWLYAAALDDDPWISDVDALGRPKKLMKCGTVAALKKEADKQIERKAQKLGLRKTLPVSDECEVYSVDGYRVMRLLTPLALDAESAEMKHCVGLGSYDYKLKSPGSGIYSIRDPRGVRLATIEVLDGLIEQFVGRRNAEPPADARAVMLECRQELEWVSQDEFQCWLTWKEASALGTSVDVECGMLDPADMHRINQCLLGANRLSEAALRYQ